LERRTRVCEGALMRGLSRNKQTMYYSILGEPQPIYAKDSDGNIIYDTMEDGAVVPRDTGEMTNGYQPPVKFYGNIAKAGGVAVPESYGVDLSSYDAMLYAPTFDLKEMCLVFYQSEPRYKPNGDLDENSADYRVVRVPPSLDETVYLLEGVV